MLCHVLCLTAAARSGDEGGMGGGEDPRATLILTLLLGALDQPAPNLTHLLAGFNYDAGKVPGRAAFLGGGCRLQLLLATRIGWYVVRSPAVWRGLSVAVVETSKAGGGVGLLHHQGGGCSEGLGMGGWRG